MTTTSSKSFGARLMKGQAVATYIGGFIDYNPPRTEESAEGMNALISAIIGLNDTEAVQMENYRQAVNARASAFHDGPGSVEKLIPAIRGVVAAQYGIQSTELSILDTIIRRMRSVKHTAPPADPAQSGETATASRAERSFAAMTQFFNNIISCLTQFNAYTPAREALSIASLQACAVRLNDLNHGVQQTTLLLRNARTRRSELYKDLTDRIKRIRLYVRAQYGSRSDEAKLISRLEY